MLSQKKKTAQPNRKLVSLLLQQAHVPCDDDALRKTRVSASARMLVTMECLVACPRWCPRHCDERIMKMTMLSAYLPSSHTRWQALHFWRFVRQFWGWRTLCGSRAGQVRCVPLENGWDSYVMAPLIGQYSVSVTLLTNQLFAWVYLNSGPDLTKRVPSSDREREDLSIDVKHDSARWNEKKLRTIKNVVSYAVLHHICVKLSLRHSVESPHLKRK